MKIGIDIGGSHVGIGLVDEFGNIQQKKEKYIVEKVENESQISKQNLKEEITQFIIQTIKEYQKMDFVENVGIAVPGTVNQTTIIKAVNLGIENYEITPIIEKEIQLPIKIRNDAKCAALAENTIGALKDYKRSLFLTLGTGIGGAVIINDKLLDTGDLPGCEFGHMVIQRDGIKCNCGKQGCFEKYASMKALKTNLRQILGVDEKTRGQELLDIIRKNPKDEKINKVMNEYIEYLSIGISNLINIFQNKLKFSRKPLSEIFEEVYFVETGNKVSEIFLKTSQKIKEMNVSEAWRSAVAENSFFLNLKKEDIELIKSFGNMLGKTDIEGQVSEINQFLTLLDGQIATCEEEKNKNTKLCKSLGTIVGLGIVIVLF